MTVPSKVLTSSSGNELFGRAAPGTLLVLLAYSQMQIWQQFIQGVK
jgi:hypothetical protein